MESFNRATDNSVVSFTLVNADTDSDVRILSDGDVINFKLLGTNKINVRANTKPMRVYDLQFSYDNGILKHASYPYTFKGNNLWDFKGWTPKPGNHVLTATAYKDKVGSSMKIHFSVVGK